MWFYQIDGKIINKPITYRDDINPLNYELEFKEYRRGDTPRYKTAFCKNRSATPTLIWSLANDVLTVYPPRTTVSEDLFVSQCFPKDESKHVYVPIEKIPNDAITGCNHYFIGKVDRDYGGGRVETQPLKTEEFCIID